MPDRDKAIDLEAFVDSVETAEENGVEQIEPSGEEDQSAPVETEELNPAKEVTGYRILTGDDIAWMNTCKQAELELAAVCVNVKELAPSVDPRLWTLARTHFETGFMYLVRSIAKPEDPFDNRA